MSKPFDAAAKDMIESDPESWLRMLGLAFNGAVGVIDADLATVTAAADKVLRVDGPIPWLAHLELQASADASLPRRILRYNVLLAHRHDLPTRSVAVLLRPEADHRELTGGLTLAMPDGREVVRFGYEVFRVWRQPAESLLAGGLGTLALAPLGTLPPGGLPAVSRRIAERLRDEATPEKAGRVRAATGILLGLRYPEDLIDEVLLTMDDILLKIPGIETSTYYQKILNIGRDEGRVEGRDEGRVEEARRVLLNLGGKRLGPPTPQVQATIEALTDVERLEHLAERLLDVRTWDELLDGPES